MNAVEHPMAAGKSAMKFLISAHRIIQRACSKHSAYRWFAGPCMAKTGIQTELVVGTMRPPTAEFGGVTDALRYWRHASPSQRVYHYASSTIRSLRAATPLRADLQYSFGIENSFKSRSRSSWLAQSIAMSRYPAAISFRMSA